MPAASAHGDERGLLSRTIVKAQHSLVYQSRIDEPTLEVRDKARGVHKPTVEALVTDAFQQKDPPRFLLVLGDGDWILADRGKWAEQRLLRFDLEEILGRRDDATLKAMVALLHRETLAPESGTSLVDTLDDSSHKHAYEVSEDLKYALPLPTRGEQEEGLCVRTFCIMRPGPTCLYAEWKFVYAPLGAFVKTGMRNSPFVV